VPVSGQVPAAPVGNHDGVYLTTKCTAFLPGLVNADGASIGHIIVVPHHLLACSEPSTDRKRRLCRGAIEIVPAFWHSINERIANRWAALSEPPPVFWAGEMLAWIVLPAAQPAPHSQQIRGAAPEGVRPRRRRTRPKTGDVRGCWRLPKRRDAPSACHADEVAWTRGTGHAWHRC
jgi:hypothetical protein